MASSCRSGVRFQRPARQTRLSTRPPAGAQIDKGGNDQPDSGGRSCHGRRAGPPRSHGSGRHPGHPERGLGVGDRIDASIRWSGGFCRHEDPAAGLQCPRKPPPTTSCRAARADGQPIARSRHHPAPSPTPSVSPSPSPSPVAPRHRPRAPPGSATATPTPQPTPTPPPTPCSRLRRQPVPTPSPTPSIATPTLPPPTPTPPSPTPTDGRRPSPLGHCRICDVITPNGFTVGEIQTNQPAGGVHYTWIVHAQLPKPVRAARRER